MGVALGLDYPHLTRMEPLMGKMVGAWLNGEDNVSDPPSWASLIKSLNDIKQRGIAQNIMAKVINIFRLWACSCKKVLSVAVLNLRLLYLICLQLSDSHMSTCNSGNT